MHIGNYQKLSPEVSIEAGKGEKATTNGSLGH